jgi:hypothetical protein
MAGDITLRDVFQDGRVLVAHGRSLYESRGKLAGDNSERGLNYLDTTWTAGISADGRTVLFEELAQAGRPQTTAYLRRVGDTSPVRLGEGTTEDLSPDGRRAIVRRGTAEQGDEHFSVLSAGPEPTQDLYRGALVHLADPVWLADGQGVIFTAEERGRPARSYIIQPLDGQPRPVSPEGTVCSGAPGRRWLPCAREETHSRERVWELRTLDGTKSQPAPWIGANESVVAWSEDSRHAFVTDEKGGKGPPYARDVNPRLVVFRVEVATGHREPWLDTGPPDPAGVSPGVVTQSITPDGRYYAYSFGRTLADLFLIEGLR